MSKSRIGGIVIVLVGLGVIALEIVKPTVGGFLWLIIGGVAVVLGAFNILGVGRSEESE